MTDASFRREQVLNQVEEQYKTMLKTLEDSITKAVMECKRNLETDIKWDTVPECVRWYLRKKGYKIHCEDIGEGLNVNNVLYLEWGDENNV